jgi:hypothetical protein
MLAASRAPSGSYAELATGSQKPETRNQKLE